jgi:hypothetical protein
VHLTAKLFERVDADKSGSVSNKELAEALFDGDMEWMANVLTQLDVDGDGAVSPAEWKTDCVAVHAPTYKSTLMIHAEQTLDTMVERFCAQLPNYLGVPIEDILRDARDKVWHEVSKNTMVRIKNYDEDKNNELGRSEFIESETSHEARAHFNKQRALGISAAQTLPKSTSELKAELEAVQHLFPTAPLGDKVPPRIVHLIYIPWTRSQRIKDENDFNTDYLANFTARANGERFEAKLWTLSKLRIFTQDNYPGLWEFLWDRIDRPTQVVDFMRLLLVYHFGGIYLQYGSKVYQPLESILPLHLGPEKTQTRLFTESVIGEALAAKGAAIPIRRGKPEEHIRIANQLFSSIQHGAFLRYCLIKYLRNINTWRVSCDYDILYMGANAMTSEAFAEFSVYHDEKPSLIALVNEQDSTQYARYMGKGSWKISPSGLTENCKTLARGVEYTHGDELR